jgi:outer membrane protein assembly factor BamA
MATGAFKDVEVGSRASAAASAGAGAAGAGAAGASASADLVVELDERSFSLSSGVSQSLAGTVRGGTQASVINALGQAETLSLSVGSASSEISFAGLDDMLAGGFRGAGSGAGAGGAAPAIVGGRSARVLEQLATPTFTLSLHKPTLLGAPAPVDVRLRSELEFHDAQSGFVNAVREAEASITDVSGRHSVSYALAWRNLSPVRQPRALFATASSPEVVAGCDSSLKSSVSYAFSDSTPGQGLNTARGFGAGRRAAFRAELAGAGGDVHFARAALGASLSLSLLRFAPDTGFALPLAKGEAAAAAVAAVQAAAGAGADAALGGLRPHPGPALLGYWGRALSGALRADDPPAIVTGPLAAPPPSSPSLLPPTLPASAPYSLSQRIAGWLAPGLSIAFDLSLGALAPFGRSARQPQGGSRLPDRFFLFGSKCRGFDSVGPRAARVEGGTPFGDALGGDALAALSARVLLPPPLPSVRLANYGVRSQAFATVAALAPGREASSLAAFAGGASASAGLGIVVPVMAGAAVELNWALWHREGASSVANSFRVQVSG